MVPKPKPTPAQAAAAEAEGPVASRTRGALAAAAPAASAPPGEPAPAAVAEVGVDIPTAAPSAVPVTPPETPSAPVDTTALTDEEVKAVLKFKDDQRLVAVCRMVNEKLNKIQADNNRVIPDAAFDAALADIKRQAPALEVPEWLAALMFDHCVRMALEADPAIRFQNPEKQARYARPGTPEDLKAIFTPEDKVAAKKAAKVLATRAADLGRKGLEKAKSLWAKLTAPKEGEPTEPAAEEPELPPGKSWWPFGKKTSEEPAAAEPVEEPGAAPPPSKSWWSFGKKAPTVPGPPPGPPPPLPGPPPGAPPGRPDYRGNRNAYHVPRSSPSEPKVRKEWVSPTGEPPAVFVRPQPEQSPEELAREFEAALGPYAARIRAEQDESARIASAKTRVSNIAAATAVRQAAEAAEPSLGFGPSPFRKPGEGPPPTPAGAVEVGKELPPQKSDTQNLTWQRYGAIGNGDCFFDSFLYATSPDHRSKTWEDRANAAASARETMRYEKTAILAHLKRVFALAPPEFRITDDESLSTMFDTEMADGQYVSTQLAAAIVRTSGRRLVVINGDALREDSTRIEPVARGETGLSDVPEPEYETITLSYIRSSQHFEPVSINGELGVPGERYPDGLVALLKETAVVPAATEAKTPEPPAIPVAAAEPTPEEEEAVISDLTKKLQDEISSLAILESTQPVTEQEAANQIGVMKSALSSRGLGGLTQEQYDRLAKNNPGLAKLFRYDEDDKIHVFLPLEREREPTAVPVRARSLTEEELFPEAEATPFTAANPLREGNAPPVGPEATVVASDPKISRKQLRSLGQYRASTPRKPANKRTATRRGALPEETDTRREAEDLAAQLSERARAYYEMEEARRQRGFVGTTPKSGGMRKKTFKSRRVKKTNGRGTRRRKDRADRSHKNARRGA